MIFFSVIIPTYNSEKTIIRALCSVNNQTYKNYEIIIVDDGSIDNSKNIIENFFTNKHIKFQYIFQENSGPSVARNNAVIHASGKYLAFLDSDDEWHKEKLQIQYQQITSMNISFLSSKYTLSDFDLISTKQMNSYHFKDFLLKNRTSTPCTVVLKSLFDEVGGFDETLSYSEDYNLWLKISLIEPLYFFEGELVRLHKQAYGESGLSSHMWEMEKGELYNYKFLYQKKHINLFLYVILVSISLLKYLRRKIKSVKK